MEVEKRLKEEWAKLNGASLQLQALCEKARQDAVGEREYQVLSDLVSFLSSQAFYTSQLWAESRNAQQKEAQFSQPYPHSLSSSPSSSSSVHTLHTSTISSFSFSSLPASVVPVPSIPKIESTIDTSEVAAAMVELDRGPWRPAASPSLSPPSSVFSRPSLSLGPTASKQRKGKVVHPRLQKLCSWCQTESTPEWRTGPDDCILCNACGLQFRNKKKVEEECKKKHNITNLLN